jgi:lipoprotein signal peptidase
MKQFLDTFSKTNIAHILGVIIVLGCFVLMYLIIIKPIPAENKDVVNIAVGFIFGGALAGVTGYFYGASKNNGASN